MSSSSIASRVLDSRDNLAATEKNSEEYVALKESTNDFTWPLSTFVNPEDSAENVRSIISSKVLELRALGHNKLSFTSSNIEKTKDDNPSIIQSSTAAFISPCSPDDFTINHWSERFEEQALTKIISNNQSHQSSAVPDSSNDISVNHCHLSERSPSQVSDKPLCDNLQATCNSSTVSCVTQGSGTDIQQSCISLSSPSQPVLKTYARRKFNKDKGSRDFNSQWYKTYPWISFDAEHCHFVCFACREFMGDKTFTFVDWKKSNRLKKHAKSVVHKDAMTKWIGSKINAKHKTSMLKQLTESHQQDVLHNREYLHITITSIFYNTQQNVAFRGHEEDRNNIGERSNKNRRNLLELLNLRCDDILWLKDKLQSQLKLHAQWTSPSIQNDILEIISHFVVQQITWGVQLSQNYSLIMDETSDISRTEQVSIYLRHILDGKH